MDLTIKGIPEGITEAQVKEWISVLVERKANQDLSNDAEVKAKTEAAKKTVDDYRKSVGLQPKFEKVEEVKES